MLFSLWPWNNDNSEITVDGGKETFEKLPEPVDYTILHVTRKLRMHQEFRNYIANADDKTIYYNYIIGTDITEFFEGEVIKYKILANLFGTLHTYLFNNKQDLFITLSMLEL